MEGPDSDDSIAVVGMSCRLPARVGSPAQFWQALCQGRSGLCPVPDERWTHSSYYDPHPDAPGCTVARQAGFIEGVYQFDAGFFGISPREAESMDPQQRLLLELSVEALEAAGWPLNHLAGSPTGVFVALSSYDMALHADAFGWDTHAATGASPALASNRISYCLDLRGPSLTLDSACSASLTALDVACRSLRSGQCRQALLGAVNLLLDPAFFLAFSRLHMLSASDHSRAFQAGADGYVRGEGAVVLVLKPLAAALHDGDRVWGRIVDTAVNQDGHSAGITAPNPQAQEALLRQVYGCPERRRRLAYVETHGTGTPLGDPVEARALGAVLASPERTLWIGSAKAQFGHLEGAAGALGLLKALSCLQHGQVPPQAPEPVAGGVDLKGLGLGLVERPLALDPQALIGVSSFGFGGTNAHALVAGPLAATRALDNPPPCELIPWPVSAASEPALRARVGQLLEALEGGADLVELARTLGCRLAPLAYRRCFLGNDREELGTELRRWLESPTSARMEGGPRPVFVFCGQGPQWPGMGRELMRFPAYRRVLEHCDKVLQRLGGWSLLEVLQRSVDPDPLQETLYAQPALFALQMGLVELWKSWGLEPAAVVGHSVGEVAAACCGGYLTLEQGLEVIFQRASSMQRASMRGRMAVLEVDESRARSLLSGWNLEVGALNAPESVTLSGPAEELEAFLEQASAQGLSWRPLTVQYAFHSRLVEPVREPLLHGLSGLVAGQGPCPMISTVTGRGVNAGELNADYWWRNVRQTVRFAPAVQELVQQGHRLFVEVGPHPVLTSACLACAEASSVRARAVASLRRQVPQHRALLEAVAELWQLGQPVDWQALLGAGPWAPLPAYPWDRSLYRSLGRDRQRQLFARRPFRLLGRSRDSARCSWEGVADGRTHAFLVEHRLDGVPLISASTLFELALEALADQRPEGPCQLQDLRLLHSCFLESDASLRLRSSLGPEGIWTLHALSGQQRWELVAQGRGVSATAPRGRCHREGNPCPPELVERGSRAWGFEYGPFFQTPSGCWLLPSGHGLQLELDWPDDPGFVLHPGALDLGIRALLALTPARSGQRALPSRLERFSLWRRPRGRVLLQSELLARGPRHWNSRVRCFDGQGLCWEMEGLRWDLLPASRPDGGGLLQRSWSEVATGPVAASLGVRLEGPGRHQLGSALPAGEAWRCFVAEEADPLPQLVQLLGWVGEEAGDARWALITRPGPGQEALRGFWRALQLEYPGRRPRMIELPEHPEPADLQLLATALEVEHENELRICSGRLLKPRWRALEPEELALQFPADSGFQAVPARAATAAPAATVVWVHQDDPLPGPGQVLLEVQAWGLNFSDVLKSLGLYPLWGGTPRLGLECAGRVLQCGPGVENCQPGQAVVALGVGLLGRRVVTRAELVAPWPEGLSPGSAASLPLVTTTAWMALRSLAQLQPGERLLVHSGSGGVGLAALQLGKSMGARLWATAGTPERRQFLQQWGVPHVYDSRSLDFVARVLDDTEGQGLDVVVNSLSGEALEAGLQTLAPGGRWIELGKRDLDEQGSLPMEAFRRGLSFISLDLEARMLQQPAAVGEALRQALQRDWDIPCQSWSAAELPSALNYFSSRQHRGKLAVCLEAPPALQGPDLPHPQLKPEEVYVISGGLSGLGAELAFRLLRWGARRLWLLGRRGLKTPGAVELKRHLEALGAQVAVMACDVARLEGLPDPPEALGGIFHAANHMEDRVLAQLDPDSLARVYASKAEGAWQLHRWSLNTSLKHFVLFGSISAAFGAAGQAAYCAANGYLEGLADVRRRLGLPALLVHWGPLIGTGYLQRHPEVLAHLQRRGHQPLEVDECLDQLGRLMGLAPFLQEWPAVCRSDWGRFEAPGPRLQELQEMRPAGQAADQAALEFVVDQARRILRLDQPEQHLDRSLRELGMDSLLAVEFRNAIERRFQIALPMAGVLRGPTLRQLAEDVEQRSNQGRVEPSLLPHLSDEEVRQLLRQLETAEPGHQPPPSEEV